MTLRKSATGVGVRDGLRVIYLGGLGRSGSTLLERLLGELPEVCVLGEVVHLWQRGLVENERCGCGADFGSCAFWSRVGAAAFGGWEQVSADQIARLRAGTDRFRFLPLLASGWLPPAYRRRLAEYTSYYARLYQAAADVSGCGTVVDSSKHASLAFCLSRASDIDLRVVQMVRDPRAVAYSWTTRVARPESSTESYMTTYSPARAAGYWDAENAALAVLAARGTPVLRVRYEDLVRAPEQTTRLVAEFAGLRAGPDELGFLRQEDGVRYAALGESHTASGNPMRFATGKVLIRGDERWRAAMPAGNQRTVAALTLPLLSRYGYLGRAPHEQISEPERAGDRA